MSIILFEAEKQAIWNDQDKLESKIKALSLRLAKNATQISYYESEKEKARCAFEEAELQLRILTDFYKEINDAELLLTKRLMELEKEMGEL